MTLADFNALDPESAAAVLPCNGSEVWATLIAHNRPYAAPEALFAAADRLWLSLEPPDWQQAFDSHPRIGESKATAATETSLKWSEGEQSSAHPTENIQTALAIANRNYEATFGRIFIVCATGKSANEMLSILQQRLTNDPTTELHEAAEQQRQITQLRLRKWLSA